MQPLHDADRRAIAETEAIRSLVVEWLHDDEPRDLFNACARLGRMLHAHGASPTLTASAIDALSDDTVDAARVMTARALVAEGYAAAVVDAEQVKAQRAWEFPDCAIAIDVTTIGIVCGHPLDDREALGDWGARVALSISKAGFRRATLAGPEPARAEVANACALLGIDCTGGNVSGGSAPPSSAWWSWRPWRIAPRLR